MNGCFSVAGCVELSIPTRVLIRLLFIIAVLLFIIAVHKFIIADASLAVLL